MEQLDNLIKESTDRFDDTTNIEKNDANPPPSSLFRTSVLFQEIEETIRKDHEASTLRNETRRRRTKDDLDDQVRFGGEDKRRSRSEPKLPSMTSLYRTELNIVQLMPGDYVISSHVQKRLEGSSSSSYSWSSSSSSSSSSNSLNSRLGSSSARDE